MAADCVNIFAPSQPTSVDRLGPVELWHRPRPSLWLDDRCRHPGLSVGLLRNDAPRTTSRLVSRCQGQKWRQTGPQTAQPGGDPVFCPSALLGGGLDRPHLSPSRPRHGRLDAGAALHSPVDQRGRPWLCHPRGLAHRRGDARWCLAPPLGSPLWPLTRQCARRLDCHCAGRPGLVRALALYDNSSPGLASLLTHQSPRSLSSTHLCRLSSAGSGGQPRGAAVGRPRALLCHSSAATLVHSARTLGCGVSRPLVDPDRPAADRRRCRVVCVACLDRMWLQRQQTRRLALGTDQDAGTRTGGAPLARPGGRHFMDRQCGLPGRSHTAPAPGESAPGAAYRPHAVHGPTPGALTQLLPAWSTGHPGCTLSWAAPAGGVHTPRTVAEQSRDDCRSAPCLPTTAQCGIRKKPTLERGVEGHCQVVDYPWQCTEGFAK